MVSLMRLEHIDTQPMWYVLKQPYLAAESGLTHKPMPHPGSSSSSEEDTTKLIVSEINESNHLNPEMAKKMLKAINDLQEAYRFGRSLDQSIESFGNRFKFFHRILMPKLRKLTQTTELVEFVIVFRLLKHNWIESVKAEAVGEYIVKVEEIFYISVFSSFFASSIKAM